MPTARVRSRIRHVLLGLGTGAAVALLLLLVRGTYAMQALELKTLDLRFRTLTNPARADTGIVIVDVDNYSLELLRRQLGRFPWRREVFGWLTRFAAAGGARAIAFDFAFPEPDLDHPASDSAFALEARRAGNVVQTLSLQRDTTGVAQLATLREDSAALKRLEGFAWPGTVSPAGGGFQSVEHPYPLLLESSRAVGVINFTPDPVDGTLRRAPLFYGFKGRAYPALGLATAAAAEPERFKGAVRWEPDAVTLGAVRIPAKSGALLLNWRGPYRIPGRLETYRVYPAVQILSSLQRLGAGERPEVPLEAMKGKIVFVGSSASGLFEARANPFGPSDPGVLMHATIADNLLHGDVLREATLAANAALTLLAALLAGLAVALIASAWRSAGAGGLLLVLLGALVWALFARWQLVLDAAAPGVAIALTFTAGMSLNYVTEGRRKRQIREMFSKYVAPEYVATLADDPKSLDLGGHRASLSILFSDIRGFTSISEKLEPHQVIELLNEYLTQMAAIVKQSGGTLDKFIGDAVMAFWGEPVKRADHAERAADCALAMREAVLALAARWVSQGKPDLRIGIGINTADVVVGNIGSLEHKLDYTVIGDGVNLASRLEGLNKDFGTTIIISEFTRAQLADRFQVRSLGDVKVKGKEQPIPIYELLGRTTVALALLLATGAAGLLAQKAQWSEAVYAPGRWAAGRLVPATTSNAQTDSLALLARVDCFSSPPRWRAEIRRSTDGQAMGQTPDVLIGNGATVVVLTPVGTTPLAQHALGRDALVRSVAQRFDGSGRRVGAANGRLVEKAASGQVSLVVFRRAARSAAFDDALLNPGGASGARGLLASNIRAVGDQRNAGVVATAGARGVDRVNTPGGQVAVRPDTMAVVRMETFAVGSVALEEFMRRGKLGAYSARADSAGRP